MNNIEKLPRQTYNTANDILLNAIQDIDNHMGENYSRLHPELVASYMNAEAADNSGIVRALNEINETLRRLYRRYDDVADRD